MSMKCIGCILGSNWVQNYIKFLNLCQKSQHYLSLVSLKNVYTTKEMLKEIYFSWKYILLRLGMLNFLLSTLKIEYWMSLKLQMLLLNGYCIILCTQVKFLDSRSIPIHWASFTASFVCFSLLNIYVGYNNENGNVPFFHLLDSGFR